MIENLEIKQREIILIASRLVRPAERENFEKYVIDVLRGKVQPLSNTDIRSTCCSVLLKFRR
jgi:hypothetical protein